jgi:hypothetical protein
LFVAQYLENGEMTDSSLLRLLEDLSKANGRPFDLYHSEEHRAIIITEQGVGLSKKTAVVRITY